MAGPALTRDLRRPIGSFVFLGPDRVGKTDRRRGRLVVVGAVGSLDVVGDRILAALARRADAGIPPPPAG